jgi:hypothetical protein
MCLLILFHPAAPHVELPLGHASALSGAAPGNLFQLS